MACVLGFPILRAADTEPPIAHPGAEESVEVTATKYPDDPDKIPQSMTVISGQDLIDRGATGGFIQQ